MSGLGLLATLAAGALLWDEQKGLAWLTLAVAVLEGALTAQELALRWRGGQVPKRWVGAPPVALLVGCFLLIVALVS